MKLISWNVNGIRAALRKDFMGWFEKEKPDILCIQETKAWMEQVDLIVPGYEQFWNQAEKKGYSGTLVLTNIKPKSVGNGIGILEHDTEGRVQTIEFNDFFLVNVYTPNAQRTLGRLKYRQEWDKEFLKYIKELEKTKPVITCGDFNVAPQEIDIARAKENRGNAGFTDEERKGFQNMMDAGFIDTFRHLHPDEVKYSWWAYMFNSRAKNIGWRIDHVLMSNAIKPKLREAFILTDVMGSDHCPVGITLQ